VRERFEALRDAFDGWLDRISERVEPAADRFNDRNQAIEAWFERSRPPAGRIGVVFVRLLYRLAKTAGLLVVFAVFFLIIAPIAIVLLLAAGAIVFSPLILVYAVLWWVLGAAGIGDDTMRLVVLGAVTYLVIRVGRRVLADRHR